ncbi:MAG: hypothetical protein ABSF63_04515 [Candidatus Bathyarchaeia archaeon]|jgi:hypothetical protein
MSANPLEELARLAREKSRRLFVAEMPIDLTTNAGSNCVFVLELPGSAPGAAGGRIGGIGERRIEKAYCFRQVEGSWVKVYETETLEKLERFELPYHAAGMSVILPDGSERVVSGVVDQELIQRYNEVV